MSEQEIQSAVFLPIDQLVRQCRFERLRRSGPGGQHRNKVETAVRVEHISSGIRGEASERRSQALNREAALHRLRVAMAVEIRRELDETSEPSLLWRSRIEGRKVRVSSEHVDFPPLLAESLDFLLAEDYDVAKAAARLGCSSTQLVRFLKSAPQAFVLLNKERSERGLSPMR
jgi:hypothetical protein